ncbi:GNVR domain-containing protein [Burkholderia sp. BDU5]|uniref:GNVR domain-containing protein n=1 Tax=Burkholderia sp. BDU5 TaxID=1385590 RepID=UPI00075AE2A1|nr:GNVR domain-containing protein [Burkholderia sp. BDU5]KVE42088.1 multidrug MFS transporter [Burkholderia sp. BDU5]
MDLKAQPISAVPHAKRNDGLAGLWWSVVRHRRLFATIVVVFFALGVLYALVATPQYRAEALLRIQTKPGSSISALSDVSGTISNGPSANDESEVLTSRAIVGTAIEQIGANLDIRTLDYFPFVGRLFASGHANDDKLASPFLGMSGFAWGGEKLKLGEFSLPDAALGDKFRLVAGENGQWTLYDKKDRLLARGAVGQTVPFSVAVDGEQAQAGQIRVDTLRARSGIAFSIVKEPTQLVYDDVMKKMKTVVANRDSTLEEPSMMKLVYQADTPQRVQEMVNAIVRVYLQRDIAYRAEKAQRNLDSLHARLPGLKKDLEKAEDSLNRYRTTTGTIDVDQQGIALINRLNSLSEHQTVLQLALDNVKARFLPGSTTYQTVQTQLDQVKKEIQQTTTAANKLPTAQREFVRLSRQVSVATQLYTSVLTNAQQLEIAVASTTPGVSVVDWANKPYKKAWPQRGIVILGALLGGLFAGLAAAYLLARYRNELSAPQSIADVSDIPCVAVVAPSASALALDDDRTGAARATVKPLAARNPNDPGIEALRALRTSLRAAFSHDGRSGGKVLVFAGPTAGVGSSFVASNLAYLFADVNASALFVDADMRGGSHNPLSVGRNGGGIGLANVLEGGQSLDKAIIKIGKSKLSVMTPGTLTGSNPGELLERAEFSQLLATLRTRYDYVIVDAPPVLPYSDTLSIAAQDCDAVLLVSRGRTTRAAELETALQRLDSVDAKVSGHIFNAYVAPPDHPRTSQQAWWRDVAKRWAKSQRTARPARAKQTFRMAKGTVAKTSRN